MKKIIVSLAVALVAITSSFAQYYGGEPVGTVYEYEITNPLMGKMTMTRTLDAIDGKLFTFADNTQLPGQAEPLKATTKVTLSDDKIFIDQESIKMATKATLGASLGDVEISVEGDLGYTPLVGKVGDKVPLNKYTVLIDAGAFQVTTKNETIRHEVVREEELETPAGTFHTIVVEKHEKASTEAMGQSQSFDVKSTQWVVPGKGIVKIEQTTAGQVVTTTLTKITKP